MFQVRAILNTVFLLFFTTALRNIFPGSGKGKYSLRGWKGRQKTNQPTDQQTENLPQITELINTRTGI